MSPIRRALCLLLIALLLCVLSVTFSLAQKGSHAKPSNNSSSLGRRTYSGSCAACHGLDGHGSDKAVNIAAGAPAEHLSDVELFGIISNGVPGTGMPAFHTLTDQQIRAVVLYLRTLQGKIQAQTRTLPGDPRRGKAIFFGKGECSSCHMISGQGGFLGPDLSSYASTTSPTAIRDEIVKSPRISRFGSRSAVLTTAEGEQLEGLIRNEDNFSVQLQTKDGSFHLLQKSGLRNFQRLDSSLMPANYRDRLSAAELNDLVSFLMSASPDTAKKVPSRKKDEDDYE